MTEETQTAIAFAGLPGAGKTFVGDIVADNSTAEMISMGDSIREHAPDDVVSDSNKLGQFAANTRAEDPKTIPQWVTDLADESDSETFVIDGVRSKHDYEVLNSFFDEFTLVYVFADSETRLERVADRGREGEDEFDMSDLRERDRVEIEELGVGELLNISVGSVDQVEAVSTSDGYHEFILMNNGSPFASTSEGVVKVVETLDGTGLLPRHFESI